MTIINPKSISGITSITTASGADNLLTVHTNNTTERVRINNDGDVIVGSGITVSPDGDIFATGVTTATTFSGSGASLTNLPAANITGTLPAISGANLTNLPAANITGTLPAISGANLTNLDASDLASGTVPTARLGSGTASSSTFLRGDSTFAAVTSTTINNNADNRLITGSGTANTLEGEANLTFDGNRMLTVSTDGHAYGTLNLDGNNGGLIQFEDNDTLIWEIYTNTTELSIYDRTVNAYNTKFKAGGNVEIENGNLKFASGHGIDFSATSDATHTGASGANPTTDSEKLTDYEHGTWTPRLRAYDHSGGAGWGTMKYTDGTDVIGSGRYVRIGNYVWAGFKFESGSKVFDSNWTYWSIDNTPYGANHYDKASGSLYVSQTNFFTNSNSHIGGFVHGADAYMVVNKPNGHSNASINTSNNNRYCYGHISIYSSRY